MHQYSNLESFEGTISAETTVTFERRSRQMVLSNDSAVNLEFKFNTPETYATLYPGETIVMEVSVPQLILNSTGSDYRLWVFG